MVSVRDAGSLKDIGPAERQHWQKLWSDVAALRKEARASCTETVRKGSLTKAKTQQFHDLQLSAGKLYVIDMRSKQFDALLKLQDATGKQLAENDDSPGSPGLDSRLIFTPKQDGVYRLIATSPGQRGRGAYEIIVRELKRRATSS